MKLYISIDMEGLAGTFNWEQEKGPDRVFIREAMNSPSNNLKPYVIESPYELKVELSSTGKADVVNFMPSIKRLDGRTVILKHDDYGTVFEAISAITCLASMSKL